MLLLLDAPPVSFRSRNCSSRLLCGCPGASLTCAVIALFVSCYESTSWLALFAVSVLLSLPLFCWSWFVSLIAEVKLLSLSESALHPDREYVCGCVSVCLSVCLSFVNAGTRAISSVGPGLGGAVVAVVAASWTAISRQPRAQICTRLSLLVV